jgi:glutamate synthase (NADPH/NADH) large chain
MPEHAINFFFLVAEEAREIMASMGVRKLDELIGETDFLDTQPLVDHWKAHGLDFSRVFHKPAAPKEEMHRTRAQKHPIDDILDRRLIAEAATALENGQPVIIEAAIRNVHRTVGTILCSEVRGEAPVPPS